MNPFIAIGAIILVGLAIVAANMLAPLFHGSVAALAIPVCSLILLGAALASDSR